MYGSARLTTRVFISQFLLVSLAYHNISATNKATKQFCGVDQMPRVATKLAPSPKGGFIARKVIPFDVRDEYARLYGQRTEERLNSGPMPISLARAKHLFFASIIYLPLLLALMVWDKVK